VSAELDTLCHLLSPSWIETAWINYMPKELYGTASFGLRQLRRGSCGCMLRANFELSFAVSAA
jgi:hypothetical protein